MKAIATAFLVLYATGAIVMWILCELHDIELRRRAGLIGGDFPPMSVMEKLRFSLMWPYYLCRS